MFAGSCTWRYPSDAGHQNTFLIVAIFEFCVTLMKASVGGLFFWNIGYNIPVAREFYNTSFLSG